MQSVNFFLPLFTFLIVLTSCGIYVEQSPRVKEAGRISHGFIKEVQDNYPYEPFGIGGAFANTINGFLISFRTYQEISEVQAEKDIYEMYGRLIQLVNEDKTIRPYLVAWPFPGKDTDVGIYFFDPETCLFRRAPHLATISIKNGRLDKAVVDPMTDVLMSTDEYEQKYGRKFNEASSL